MPTCANAETKEGGEFGTETATSKCKSAGVINNVEIDDRGLIYGADRAGGGLHILRLTGYAKEIVTPSSGTERSSFREVKMANYEIGRRQFLLTVAGAAVFPRRVVSAYAPSYDPSAKFEISVSEVDVRKNAAGRMLKARVYRPNGPGPFPRSWICTAARGTTRTARRKNRWIARWRRVGCWWSRST